MVRKFVLRHEKGFLRLLEILPGFVSWNLILLPYWGVFVIPSVTAYFILLFNIYWFYQSFTIAISSTISHLRMQASMKYDWLADFKTFPDWKKLHHVIFVVTYREPLHTLTRTLRSIEKQNFPLNQITVVLATEARAPKEEREEKVRILKKRFAGSFGRLVVTVHELASGEAIGKSSNERYAAVYYKKHFIDKYGKDIKYYTATSCDADHVYHPNHFANLAYNFLDDPERYNRFWQAAIMYYNNIWELPAVTRIPNTLGAIWNMSQLPRTDRLVSMANYSLSYKLLDDIGYWDPDKIPEDWGIFFKAYFKKRGHMEVKPLYLPVHIDAAQSTSFIKTIKNQYQQYKRWAWGVSDDPWIIRNYFLTPGVPFLDKTMRLIHVMWSHFMWPVNWFLITLGLTIPSLLNPAFARMTLGYTVPKLSSFVLTMALTFLVIMLIYDHIYKPERPKHISVWRTVLQPLEFLLMPIVGFFFSALPGLDAHTRLMLGKYLEYKVTEKV